MSAEPVCNCIKCTTKRIKEREKDNQDPIPTEGAPVRQR